MSCGNLCKVAGMAASTRNTPQTLSAEAFRPDGHSCDAACRWAKCPPALCRCACGGAQHGISRVNSSRDHSSSPASRSRAWARMPAAETDADLAADWGIEVSA